MLPMHEVSCWFLFFSRHCSASCIAVYLFLNFLVPGFLKLVFGQFTHDCAASGVLVLLSFFSFSHQK